MIKICSFFNLPIKEERIGKVYSIANSTPFAVDGRVRCVMPTWDMVREYRRTRNSERFTERYRKLVCKRWPQIKQWMDSIEVNDEVYLCCWERTGFCHRFLVAKLLRKFRPDLKIRAT